MKIITRIRTAPFRCLMYVLGVLAMIFGAYMIYYSITYTLDYYQGYGLSVTDGLKDLIQYTLTQALPWFIYGVLLIGVAKVLYRLDGKKNEILPKNDQSVEEVKNEATECKELSEEIKSEDSSVAEQNK